MMRQAWLIVLVLVALGACMILKSRLIEPPSLRSSASAGFDTADARARLRRVLGPERPHPVDSPEADAVRVRLLAELRALGLAPRVADSFTCNANGQRPAISCARVRNVVATIGRGGAPHLLLVSHYDSTPVGPGAADDGIGVAAMLGTAAALLRTPPPRPVTLLFNEGEEAGLIGARAFLDSDPLAARIDTLVNVEARGVEGPALMFETSRPNGAALALYRAGAAQPSANSLSTDFYRMIPNSTDVEVFQARGWTILNLAVIGNETRYHSAGDDLAALDARSLGHMGAQTLGIVRASGSARGSGGEVVYADLLGRTLLVLSQPGALVVLGLLLAAATTLLARLGRSGAAGVALVLAAFAAAAALAWTGQAIAGLLRAGDYWRGHPQLISAAADLSALLGAGGVLLLAPKIDTAALRAACWWVLLAVGAGVAWLAPGAAIFFLAAPAVALGALLLPRWAAPLGIAAGLLHLVMLAPLLALAGVLLGYGASWMWALVAALILLPLLVEARDLLRSRRKLSIALIAAPALVAWIAVLAAPAYSVDRQQPFGIEHVTDWSGGRSQWLVVNDGAPLPDRFRGFEPGAEVAWSTRPRWAAPAPAVATAPRPRLEPISSTSRAGGRLIRLRLRTGGAEAVTLRAPAAARLQAAAINGSARRFARGKPDERYTLHCRGRACDGAEVVLQTGMPGPVTIELVGLAPGLPPAARPLAAARPALARPQYTPDQRVSVERLQL